MRNRSQRSPAARDRPSRVGAIVFAVSAIGLFVAAIGAQVPEGWRAGVRYQREMVPARNLGFMFCRLSYTSVRRERDGMGWSTDYPTADKNLMVRLADFTTAEVNRYPDGDVAHAVVRATDDDLFRCPFLFASDVGTAGFDEDEVEQLREYLLKGGFLWVDDFWGDLAMSHWLAQMQAILPGHTLITIDESHPLFSSYYSLTAIPQIPHIGFWRRNDGATSERGAESATPTMTAITDYHGRVVVVMTHNTDIADGWEREAEDFDFFARFSPPAYAVGINVAVFSMTR